MNKKFTKSSTFFYKNIEFDKLINECINIESQYLIDKRILHDIKINFDNEDIQFENLDELRNFFSEDNSKKIKRLWINFFDNNPMENNYQNTLSVTIIIVHHEKRFDLVVGSFDEKIANCIFNLIVNNLFLFDVYDSRLLSVSDNDERNYLEESLICKNNSANRAAIILAWTAVMHNLYTIIEICNKQGFIAEIIKRNLNNKKFKIKKISNIEDYQQFKDRDVLEIIEKINLRNLNKGLLKRLKEFLDLRNDCAHVRIWKPKKATVESFFEEIFENIFNLKEN